MALGPVGGGPFPLRQGLPCRVGGRVHWAWGAVCHLGEPCGIRTGLWWVTVAQLDGAPGCGGPTSGLQAHAGDTGGCSQRLHAPGPWRRTWGPREVPCLAATGPAQAQARGAGTRRASGRELPLCWAVNNLGQDPPGPDGSSVFASGASEKFMSPRACGVLPPGPDLLRLLPLPAQGSRRPPRRVEDILSPSPGAQGGPGSDGSVSGRWLWSLRNGILGFPTRERRLL